MFNLTLELNPDDPHGPQIIRYNGPELDDKSIPDLFRAESMLNFLVARESDGPTRAMYFHSALSCKSDMN
jgi:hypothetical protein